MREHLFHKIWMNYSPEFSRVQSTRSETIDVLHPGNLNQGDGPDFHLASIRHQSLVQYGDIELHIRCNDWYAHKHHYDPAYNSVILHIVLDAQSAEPVLRQDGTKVPTSVIGHLIPSKLLTSIRDSLRQHDLSCRNNIRHISPHVIDKQLEIASRLYLKQKKLQLLEDFDTRQSPSVAWMKMVYLGWARGLGIPANIHQLHELAEFLWMNNPYLNTLKVQQKVASIHWDYSGSRPGNRPEIRIRQLQHLLGKWNQDTFKKIVTSDANFLFRFFDNPTFGGSERRSLLNSIVLAPALSVLSEVIGRQDLESTALDYWTNIGFRTPYSIKQPFRRAGLTYLRDQHSTGLVYQYKHFCKKKACDGCLIFKNAVGG